MTDKGRNKALEGERNEILRAVAQAIVDQDFKGKPTPAAAAGPSPFSHSMLFEFLGGGRGAGIATLDWLTGMTGLDTNQLRTLTKDEILGAYERKKKDQPFVLVRDERYPSRDEAVAFMRGVVSAVAIERVQRTPLKSNDDPGKLYWVDKLREAERDIKLEAKLTPEQKAAAQARVDKQLEGRADDETAGINAAWSEPAKKE